MGIKVSHPSYAKSSHRKRARDYLSLIEPAFRDVSKAQLNYIALVTTDERVSTDTKQMLVCLALQLHSLCSSESMGHHDWEVMGWLAHRLRQRWSSGRHRCGM
jgi:hypothetical protein